MESPISPQGSDIRAIVDEGIDALTHGDRQRAAQLLAEAIRREPDNELAWLWLSGVVEPEGQQIFCLQRVLHINPDSEPARGGLSILNSSITPVPPQVESKRDKACMFPGCSEPLVKSHHYYCYAHWDACQRSRASMSGQSKHATMLNATDIGEQLGLSSHRVNLILMELGWITREKNGGNVSTEQGSVLGATAKVFSQTGKSYVLWPPAIMSNKVFLSSVNNVTGKADSVKPAAPSRPEFREKYPATHRATDGHLVRSRAEMLIDNWLYVAGVAHAYERQLPIEEEAYCDFYIPKGKVYIEYWGLENREYYEKRKKEKKELYVRHKLNLIELGDADIKALDDVLPKHLLRYGVVPD